MSESPRFSVVIPTYQRRELVLASVQALARQKFTQPFEIVVAVDGSTDGTAAALRALSLPVPLTVLEQSNRGASATRNLGASKARGEILLFLDDDMEADEQLLAALDVSHRGGADVVFGHLPLHPGSPKNFLSDGIRQWTDGRTRRLATPGEKLTLHDLMTGQMSLSRALFERIGGFDTGFTRDGSFGDEDIDFGYRLMRDGYRLEFNPKAISYQNYIIKPPHYMWQYRQSGRADVRFARKHPELASTIFELNGANDPFNKKFWRPLARLRPFSTPIVALLRWIALFLVRGGWPSDRIIRFFYKVWALQYWLGVEEAGGMPRPRPVRVLAYHQLSDLKGAPVIEPYGVPPARFRRQIRTLKRLGWQFISPDEFVAFIRGVGGLPARPVLLTFDDAYTDLLDAMPFLRSEGVPAIVFAVSSQLGGSNVWDTPSGAPRLALLDADGLRQLAANGIETGAHCRTHTPFTSLDDDALRAEFAGVVSDLETAGLRKPRMLAYPYGMYDRRVAEAARASGLDAAFIVDPGLTAPGQDPFTVPRMEVLRSDGTLGLLWKVFRAGRWSTRA